MSLENVSCTQSLYIKHISFDTENMCIQYNKFIISIIFNEKKPLIMAVYEKQQKKESLNQALDRLHNSV